MLSSYLRRGRARHWTVAVALTAGLLAIGITFLRRTPALPSSSASLLVVTTNPILYSFTANVTGTRAAVRNLLPAGASPHTYALLPADAQVLGSAQVVIANGGGLESFLQRALDLTPRRAITVIAAEGVDMRDNDPHVWLDPARAARMVDNIARGLAAADPTQAELYRQNARRYRERLKQLDQEIASRLATARRRDFLALHRAWAYFAERYGLQMVGALEEAPGQKPAASRLAALARQVRARGTRVLLNEPQHSSPLASSLARDLGLKVFMVDPLGGELSPAGYENLMRRNAQTFVRALSIP